MNKSILPIVLLVSGLVGGFAGGYFFKNYQITKLRGNFRNGDVIGQRFTPNGSGNGQNRGMMFGGGIEGEVLSVDDKSVTVRLSDGSSKIVFFSDSTMYLNTQDAKKADLKSGVKITVFGSNNSDGSVTAQRVQLNSISLPK